MAYMLTDGQKVDILFLEQSGQLGQVRQNIGLHQHCCHKPICCTEGVQSPSHWILASLGLLCQSGKDSRQVPL